MKYAGSTERGRRTEQDSLAAAVSDLAFLANHDEAAVVTATHESDPAVWYVYASQSALDVDLQRGPITRQSPGWFAVVEAVP